MGLGGVQKSVVYHHKAIPKYPTFFMRSAMSFWKTILKYGGSIVCSTVGIILVQPEGKKQDVGVEYYFSD